MMYLKHPMSLFGILTVLLYCNCAWITNVSSNPVSPKSQQLTDKESEKVSRIRDKLQKLHDMLKAEIVTAKENTPRLTDTSRLQWQQLAHDVMSTKNMTQHHVSKFRSIIAEDMLRFPRQNIDNEKNDNGEEDDGIDDEVSALQKLLKGNSKHLPKKRERPDFEQILVRTLDEWSKRDADERITTKDTEHEDKVSSLSKSSNNRLHGNGDSNDKYDAKQTPVKDSRDRQLNSDSHSDAYLEELLDQLMNRMPQTSKQNQDSNAIKALFHDSTNVAPPTQDKVTHDTDSKQNHGSDERMTEDELFNLLIKNYSGLKTSAADKPKSRSQAINALESKLMSTIDEANVMGVTVGELIKDLEVKALRTEILERIQDLLESR